MKPAYNKTVRAELFSVAGRLLLIQVLEFNDPRDCESFPLQAEFRSIQVPCKMSCNVLGKESKLRSSSLRKFMIFLFPFHKYSILSRFRVRWVVMYLVKSPYCEALHYVNS
jgi:hypothetical protein